MKGSTRARITRVKGTWLSRGVRESRESCAPLLALRGLGSTILHHLG